MSWSSSGSAKEYHSKDFEWEELRKEIENDPSLSYHHLPITSQSSFQSQDSLAWNNFHSTHSTGKFFKERRYLFKEFPELAMPSSSLILEVGCGNGSTALPILRSKETAIVYACDCSIEALERSKQNLRASDIKAVDSRFHPFYCDFSTTQFPHWLACNCCKQTLLRRHHIQDVCCNMPRDSNTFLKDGGQCCIGGVDVVTLIFTLSAVPFNRMPAAISECFSVLRPGGLLLFRDYGLYDMTMLRFRPDQKIGYREYKRSEGTRSYFFSLDSARNLFKRAGLIELELDYCCIKSVNRRNGKTLRRVWVHGKFQKPAQDRSMK